MNITLLSTIALFAFIMSVTPGPNNIMLLASGAQFGYKRTLPHIIGIVIGIALLLASVLLGFGLLFARYPVLYDWLKIVGSVYLLWLAWKITTAPTDSDSLKEKQAIATPMRFHSATLFQFLNPKAWAMAVGSVSSFTLSGDQYLESGLWIMLCFAITGFFAISLWAYLGVAIRRLLTNQKRKRAFNYTMGAMTAATLLFMLN